MDWAGTLRNELQKRALAWAASQAVPYYTSLGQSPTVLFEQTIDYGGHGNFHPDSWIAIANNASWKTRLEKPHPKRQALPIEKASARELDSSNSSDASLMNCFCFPSTSSRIIKGLGLSAGSEFPEFGVKARLPLVDGGMDATELNMRIASNIFEEKLTEKDFTARPRTHVFRYRDLDSVFDTDALPSAGDELTGYQLIRNVLAAVHLNASLTVLIDQRGPDLLEEWWRVHAAIKNVELRLRCGFRSWQQVAAASPPGAWSVSRGQIWDVRGARTISDCKPLQLRGSAATDASKNAS